MNPYDFYITPEEYEQAAMIGVTAHNLERRIRLLGWSKQTALTTPTKKHKARDHYSQWVKLAEENGICYASFMSRIHRGWNAETAATKPLETEAEVKEHARRAAEHIRRHPPEFLRLAEQNGIPWATFHYRVIRSKWDYHRAATEPIWNRSMSGQLGAKRLKEREGDWAAEIFRKRKREVTK